MLEFPLMLKPPRKDLVELELRQIDERRSVPSMA